MVTMCKWEYCILKVLDAEARTKSKERLDWMPAAEATACGTNPKGT